MKATRYFPHGSLNGAWNTALTINSEKNANKEIAISALVGT
jgi:hypothetical protein